MAPYMRLHFFSNNVFIKIDMNLHKNVIVSIFPTSFIKLQLDFTKILQTITIFFKLFRTL